MDFSHQLVDGAAPGPVLNRRTLAFWAEEVVEVVFELEVGEEFSFPQVA